MTRERRILLAILVVVFAGSVVGLSVSAGVDRLASLNAQLQLLKKEYARSAAERKTGATPSQVAALGNEVHLDLAHYYRAGQIDPYRFATLVQHLLGNYGITVDQFKTTKSGGRILLDYTTEGSSYSVMRFLRAVSNGAKYWPMPYIHIHPGASRGSVICEFEIGYAVQRDEKKK